MPSKRPVNTIVVLALKPRSKKDSGEPLVRICESGVGRNLVRAESELNIAIRTSEQGERDLVPLHRLQARRVHSTATTLETLNEALECVYAIAGNELPLALPGFFEISVEDAIDAISRGLLEYSRRVAALESRQKRAAKRRAELRMKKRALLSIIREAGHQHAGRTEELNRALDGSDGKALQRWATNQFVAHKKRALLPVMGGVVFKGAARTRELNRALDGSDGKVLQSWAKKEFDGLKRRALLLRIRSVVYRGAPHSEDLCRALDGLEGKSIQEWATAELDALQREQEKRKRRIDGLD